MPAPEPAKVPNATTGWFSRLPRSTQALLLALLAFAVSAVTLFLGILDARSGDMAVSMAGRSDGTDMFLASAGTFVLGLALSAVAWGWHPEKGRLKNMFRWME